MKQTKTPTKLSKIEAETGEVTPVTVKIAPNKRILVLAIIILLAGLGIFLTKKYKGLIIAGTVNGKPITRWELEKSLNDRYGKATFDDLSSSMLLKQLADKNQITVSAAEVKTEIDATKVRIGGEQALQAALDRLGYTTARFEDEMKTQVMVRKLSEKLFKVEISDADVSKFYQDNKTLFPQKTLDDVKADIKANLVQQKLQEQFSTWFQDQRKNAQVVSFI